MQAECGSDPAIGPAPPHRFSTPVVQGRFSRLGLKPGLEMSLFDLDVTSRYVTRSEITPCLAIVVLCHAAGSGWIDPAGDAAPLRLRYRSGRTYVSLMRGPAVGGYDVPGGTRFRGLEVRAAPVLLDRLGMGRVIAALDDTHPLHAAANGHAWLGEMATTRQVGSDVERLLTGDWGRHHDVLAESCALAVLGSVLSALRAPSGKDRRALRDGRKLQAARALLLADLARPWTIGEVAREVGLAEKRLKVGFRDHYGVPVYAFLQQARLAHARDLLTGGMSVTEAALVVGYSNPSRFAQIFRREFGLRPSELGAPHG